MTMTPPDPSALLMGGGGRWTKFDAPGDSVKGELLSVEARQATTIEGAPKTFDNGDPIWEVVVTIQTDLREDAEDDGQRKVALGGSKKYASKAKAAADAVKASGASKLEVGGTFALAYTGDGEPTQRGYSAPKLFQAAYKAPVAGVDLGNLLGDDGF